MQQLTLPSSNISNYSNVSKQSESLVSGLNNIIFDTYNNTCIFNNKMFGIDKSITIDIINKLFYNIEGISFGDRSFIKGISDGYTLDDNDNLVLYSDNEIALSTVFGYNIKNALDITDNNLYVEIMSRQADMNVLVDNLNIIASNAKHAESMIHYIDYDLENHAMSIFVPVESEDGTEGYMDELPPERINGLSEEDIKKGDPSKGLTIDSPQKYINQTVAYFSKEGLYAPSLISNVLVSDNIINTKTIQTNDILNNNIIQTSDIVFYNKVPDLPQGQTYPNTPDEEGKVQTGILNGIDLDMHHIELNPEVLNSPNYDKSSLTHTVCSYLIREHIEQLYRRIAKIGLQIDCLREGKYDDGIVNKSIDFYDPYVSDKVIMGPKVELEQQNLNKYKYLEDIHNLQESIKTINKTDYSTFVKAWDWAPLNDNRAFQWIKSKFPIEIDYYKDRFRDAFPTLTVHGDLEVDGNIYIVRKYNEEASLKTKDHFDNGDKGATEMTFNPRPHEHSQYATTTLVSSLSTNISTNTTDIKALKGRIDELEKDVKQLMKKNNDLTKQLNDVIKFIKMESWNTHEVEIEDLKLVDV